MFENAAFLIACDLNGYIRDILHDDFNIGACLILGEVFDRSCLASNAEADFVEELRSKGEIKGRHWPIKIGDETRKLYFSGLVNNLQLLIAGTASSAIHDNLWIYYGFQPPSNGQSKPYQNEFRPAHCQPDNKNNQFTENNIHLLNAVTFLENNQHLREVLDHMPAVVSYWDKHQRNLFGNKAYETWFGIPPEKMHGMHARDVIGEKLYQLNSPYIEAVLQGEPQHFEREIKNAAGGEHHVIVSYFPNISAGDIVGFYVLATDITEQKNFEKLLVASEKRYRALLHNASDAILISDLDGYIEEINQSGERLTGFNREEILGLSISKIYPDEDVALTRHHFKETSGFGTPYLLETKIVCKDGSAVDVEMRLSLIEIGDRTIVQAVIIDLTYRKQQEQQRIEKEAAHRNALIREVHHRIKNNLQGITGVLRQFAAKHAGMAEPINEAISQLQSIAVIHGLQGKSSSAQVRLCELTCAIANGIESLWQKPVIVDIPFDWVPCIIDETETVPLALVLNELISNAVKHGKNRQAVNIMLSQTLEPYAVRLKIQNAGRLPNNFSRLSISASTGLRLVNSLLPPKGASLSWRQQCHMVETLLELEPAIIRVESNPR